MTERTSEEFMTYFKGIPAHKIARALNRLTPGVIWTGVAKKDMAADWERGAKSFGMDKVSSLSAIGDQLYILSSQSCSIQTTNY